MQELTQERLRELLFYDPTTGRFIWRVRPSRNVFSGSFAGRTSKFRYVEIQIEGRHYKAHRLAWLYMHGSMPANEVDHINGNKTDNRWENLRSADRSENQQNKGKCKNNTSGFKGVSRHCRDNVWQANIKIGGEKKYLGRFKTAEEAYFAYCKAASELHGDFSNFGASHD